MKMLLKIWCVTGAPRVTDVSVETLEIGAARPVSLLDLKPILLRKALSKNYSKVTLKSCTMHGVHVCYGSEVTFKRAHLRQVIIIDKNHYRQN